MPITALYAGLLTALFMVLSLRVIALRRSSRVPIGDGGQALMLRRMRVQANFAEYVPLALILLGLAENLRVDALLLHGLGGLLLLGRLLHAFGMSQANETFAFRVAGVGATATVLILAAAACVYLGLRTPPLS